MIMTEHDSNGTTNSATGETQKEEPFQESMSSIKHKFLVMSSQRGVGKTSVIANLGVALSKRGVRVGLLDSNFHNPDICRMLGLEPETASNSQEQFIPAPYSDDLKVASIESVMQSVDVTGGWEKPLRNSDIQKFISSVNWGSLDYLLIDTPAGPGEGLLNVIGAIPQAETIIVTAPNRIGRSRAKNMIDFFEKEKVPIFGWIENMQGFFCQDCGKRHELFSSGSGSRAVFLGDIPFLGRIPIDPHMVECADAGQPFLEKYPESEIAEACNLIINRIWEGNRPGLSEDRPDYDYL